MSKPIIEVSGLSKSYRLGAIGTTSLREEFSRLRDRLRGVPHPKKEEFWALREVSFAVQPGEVLGVIGRNGAGKSTLLKILSRITEPTHGQVKLRGRVASLLEVGTGFHPELTGRENVYLNGAILGMTRAEVRRKFDEIVAFAEVDQFIDTPVKRYSSGMYVRLAFAVAAHLEPEILIVDEVLAVGDSAFQQKCLERIDLISRHEHRTVLLVSHNLNAVLQLCTQAIYLADGRLFGAGPPAEIVRNYFGAKSQSADQIDLSARPRSSRDRGRARLMRVKIGGVSEGLAWQIPWGNPVALEFVIQVSERLQRLELGLGLFNLQGFEIATSLSTWNQAIGPLEPGRYRLEACYPPLGLVTGTYRIGVGLRSESDMEDHLGDACEVEIVPSPASQRQQIASLRGALAATIETKITRLNG